MQYPPCTELIDRLSSSILRCHKPQVQLSVRFSVSSEEAHPPFPLKFGPSFPQCYLPLPLADV